MPIAEGVLERVAFGASSELDLDLMDGRVCGVKVSGEGERLLLLGWVSGVDACWFVLEDLK